MYRFSLLVVAVTLLTGSVTQAARYKTDGTFVDPIVDTGGWEHRYSRVNLEPDADLNGAYLSNAGLAGSTLSGATLTGATLTGANLHQALLPSVMLSLPVVNGAVVTVSNALSVSGSVQVDTVGKLSVTSESFTATGVNMQGGTVAAALYGLDLDQIGDISGYGQLFGYVDLGTDGAIAGSGAKRSGGKVAVT